MFERPQSGERAILVHAGPDGVPDDSEREEFAELARSAGAVVVHEVIIARRRPDPRHFVGKGKLVELQQSIETHDAELIISSAALSPSQERNLERVLRCRVVDRAGLILDIFAQRARSFEGKLQVELAQLRHLSTRLVRGWTHLERQKGGIGLRGPGETQLETDRRLLENRIRQLRTRLEQVDKRRTMNRRNRVRAEVPTVALVGYTNAGKSTLFNALTDAGVYVKDQLFATLDPTIRRLELPDGMQVVLADTVGFVRDLPHELVAAFRSTLQEAREADLILHLIDASDGNRWQRVRQVNSVLKQLDADRVPQIRVYNKIDKLERRPRITSRRDGERRAVWLSATTGEGVRMLLETISDRLQRKTLHGVVHLQPSQGRQRAKLFELGAVLNEESLDDGGWTLELKMAERDFPHELVAAFRSTLQEAREADLILHLIDASDGNRWQRVRQVNSVLKQLDADRVPQIRVYNKIDKLERRPRITSGRHGERRAVWLSATTGEGVPMLLATISDRLQRKTLHGVVHLQPSQGRQRAKLFDLGAVLNEESLDDGGWALELKMVEREFQRFIRRENLESDILDRLPMIDQAAAATSK